MDSNFIKENRDYILFAFVAMFFYIIFSPQFSKKEVPVVVENQVIETKKTDYEKILETVEAKSYFVYDVLNGQAIFAKDEHNSLPLASITKLMSGLVVLDIMPDPTIVTITYDDIAQEGDSGLVVGEKWNLKDLIDFSLITSSNDGMHAIASTLNYYASQNNQDTIKIMNERAKNYGMKDTIFVNETGLDIDNNMAGAYSSAYDVAKLLENILRQNPGLIASTNKTSEDFVSLSDIRHNAINTNTFINKIPGLMASKTGFTSLAGGNLAVIFDAGFMHPIAIVVLGSTTQGRFEDVVKLEKATLEKISEFTR